MMQYLDRYIGWVTQFGQRTDFASLVRAFSHLRPKADCLARRQGLCPGTDLCHDCPWSEGTSREER